MLTVGFDDQIFQLQQRGGISRYFTELIGALRAQPELGIEVVTPFRRVINEHLVELDPQRYRLGSRRASVRRAGDSVLRRRTTEPALLHTTYYDPVALPPRGRPTVSTVHDMIPELLPDLFPGGNPHRAKREYVLESAGIVCVSEATRADLASVYGHLAGVVAVVPHGVGDEFRNPAPAVVGLPARYVLFVGQRRRYKDWRVLVDALPQVPGQHDLSLVCLGGGAFTEAERALLEARGFGGRAVQLAVADRDLPGVYASAEALVFPSRYEGFGLPILEAMAAGCPVVAADTECFREVADTAAAFFTPLDPSDLASRLSAVLGDAGVREKLTDAGRLRAEPFTWARTAELTAALYHQVAS